jgi:hypothetical protein
MSLTDLACRTTKPAERLKKLSDGGGLQLWIYPNGAKLWRFAYRFGGKQKLLALGSYPLVPLADARSARDAAKRELLTRVDPSEVRKQERAQQAAAKDTFSDLCDELIKKLEDEKRTRKTINKVDWLLDFARPALGSRPITSIRPIEILEVLRKMGGACAAA